jgi:hypothetical protein
MSSADEIHVMAIQELGHNIRSLKRTSETSDQTNQTNARLWVLYCCACGRFIFIDSFIFILF